MPNFKKKKKHERKQRGGLAVTRELGGGRIRGQPPWKRDGESRGSRGRQARAASRGGAAQDPAQPVGPARGACEPGGHTPARPGWGGAAGHLPLPVQSDRMHHTSTTRPRTRRVIKHFRVRRQLFTGNLCTPGKVPGGRAQTGRRPAAEHAALRKRSAAPQGGSQSSAEAAIGSGTVRQPRPGQNQTRTSCPSPRRSQRFGLLSIIRKRSKTRS